MTTDGADTSIDGYLAHGEPREHRAREVRRRTHGVPRPGHRTGGAYRGAAEALGTQRDPRWYDATTDGLVYFERTPVWGAAYYRGFRRQIAALLSP